MLLTILQGGGPPLPIIILLSVIGFSALGVSILTFKIGLGIVKADSKTKFKWVLISYFIQLIVIGIIASPLILLGIAGAFRYGGPEPSAIIITILIAIFIVLNTINVIHHTGLRHLLLQAEESIHYKPRIPGDLHEDQQYPLHQSRHCSRGLRYRLFGYCKE